MKVLIVPDKFKGTLTAQDAAEALAQGWQEARPDDKVERLPMSDGGDGFGEVLAQSLGAERRTIATVDAAHRPCTAPWWFAPQGGTSLIESARVIGLALLPSGQYHPFDLDTYGLGPVLQVATAGQLSRCLIGIGGSATNDGGFGLAKALGWTFLSRAGIELTQWTQLVDLAHIHPPLHPPQLPELVVATDVRNPLLGPKGASRIYGPQKGLRAEDMPLTEDCLGQLAAAVLEELGLDVASEPGTGAAGGLGFGLRCFAGAQLQSGFELFALHARLDQHIGSADLVITGEGELDDSSLMGKGVGEVAVRCRKLGIPCVGLAGRLGSGLNSAASPDPFSAVYGITSGLASPEEATKHAAIWLERLAKDVGLLWGRRGHL